MYVYLTPARTGLDDAQLLVLRLAVTFALAVASYRLVEQPIRQNKAAKLTRHSVARRAGESRNAVHRCKSPPRLVADGLSGETSHLD